MRAALLVTASSLALGCAPATAGSPDAPWPRHTIDASSRGADGVRLMDVNGDGRLDVVTGWEEGGVVRVYANPGGDAVRAEWPRVTVGEVDSAEDAVPVDLDGDGAVDVVSATEGESRTLYVHWAPRERGRYMDAAAWTTEAIPAARDRTMWMYVLPMQVDGRHGPDLIVGSKGSDGLVGWLQAPADARDLAGWTLHPLPRAGWTMSLIARDMDADGDDDVVVSDRRRETRGVFWLENPGPATAATGAPWPRHAIGGEDRELLFVDVADLDGDGRAEVLASVATHGVAVYRRGDAPGAGWTESLATLDSTLVGTAKSVRAADFDGDGRLELALTFENAHPPRAGVVLAPLPLPATLGADQLRAVSGPAGVKFDLAQLADLDGDGDLDLVTTEEVEGLGVVWYENGG